VSSDVEATEDAEEALPDKDPLNTVVVGVDVLGT
jgi:hypothetical protein